MQYVFTKSDVSEINSWLTTWNAANVYVPHDLRVLFAKYDFQPITIAGAVDPLQNPDNIEVTLDLSAADVAVIRQCIDLNLSNMNINRPSFYQALQY